MTLTGQLNTVWMRTDHAFQFWSTKLLSRIRSSEYRLCCPPSSQCFYLTSTCLLENVHGWLLRKKCILYISKHWEMFIINVTLLLLPNAENNLGIKKFIQKAEIIENIKKIVSSLICRFSYFLKDMLWNNRLFISCVF